LKPWIKNLLPLCLFLVPALNLNPYFNDILIIFLIYTIYGQSLNLLTGYVGEISFGHAAFFGLGAYTSAIMVEMVGLSYWLSLFIVVILVGLVGWLIAKLAFKTVKGIYFAIVTFAITYIFYFIANEWESVTKGAAGIADIDVPRINILNLNLVFDNEQMYLGMVIVFTIAITFIIGRIVNSGIGRAFIAIREGEDLSKSIGINIVKYKTTALVISACIAAISGSIYAHYIGVLSPSIFSLYYVSLPLLIVVVGGKGTIAGPFIGTALFQVLPEFMHFSPELKMIVFGLLLLFSILFMPEGVYNKFAEVFIKAKKDKVTGNA